MPGLDLASRASANSDRDGRVKPGHDDEGCRLHVRIVRAAAAFGVDPDDVLGGALDVAGFAVDAVLCVDLQPRLRPIALTHDLVDTGRAIALLRRVIDREID